MTHWAILPTFSRFSSPEFQTLSYSSHKIVPKARKPHNRSSNPTPGNNFCLNFIACCYNQVARQIWLRGEKVYVTVLVDNLFLRSHDIRMEQGNTLCPPYSGSREEWINASLFVLSSFQDTLPKKWCYEQWEGLLALINIIFLIHVHRPTWSIQSLTLFPGDLD